MRACVGLIKLWAWARVTPPTPPSWHTMARRLAITDLDQYCVYPIVKMKTVQSDFKALFTQDYFTLNNYSPYPQLVQFLTDLNEAQMQFAPKMISKATVIVMETKVCGTDLTNTQLLLLETGCRHRITVFLLSKIRKRLKLKLPSLTFLSSFSPP